MQNMKFNTLIKFAVVAAIFSGSAQAVTVGLNGFANESQGFITAEGAKTSGTVYFVTTATQYTAANFTTAFSSVTSLATFQTAVAGLGTVVRTASFTSGAMSTTGQTEMGAVDSNVYMFLVSDVGGTVFYGAYQHQADVPSLGAVTFNPAQTNDFQGHGTSVFANAGPNSTGFQLVAIPEPSVALLGALGVLGLVRRRR